MTKSELIEAVAQRTKITKSRAEQVVNCVFDTMTAALERDEGIEIRGFGSFTVRKYSPYDGRNPRTGRSVAVPEKRLPFFKVGKELKVLVNEGTDGSAASENESMAGDAGESGRSATRNGANDRPGGDELASSSAASRSSALPAPAGVGAASSAGAAVATVGSDPDLP